MNVHDPLNQTACPVADISAYLDGELSPRAELDLERHLASCADCTRELNEQKSLLLALDSTLDEPPLELPKNFSKAIATVAESRVSGLRRPNERLNAALVCAALLLFSVLVLGSSTGRVFGAFASILQSALAVVSTGAHFVYNISLGSAVIFRTLFSNLVAGSSSSALLYAVVFFGALFIFSRLFFRQSGT